MEQLFGGNPSGVAKERLEAVIHMLLNVAVEERKTRLVGGEVHRGAAIIWNHHGVFDNARGLPPVDLRDLPKMAVQVHGVGVIGVVAHDEPIPCALLQDELAVMQVGLAADQSAVELARAAGILSKGKNEGLLRGADLEEAVPKTL